MSIGNSNSEGNKGKNFPWQYKVLQGLQQIFDKAGVSSSILQQIEDNTDGLEGSLNQILAQLQTGQDFEATLVVDDDGVLFLEVRIWNADTQTWEAPAFYPPGSNTPGSPTLPISYLNPSAILSQILVQVTPTKINRIKAADDYNRTLTYDPVGDENVTVIVHNGTTALGSETITETITYDDPTVNGSQILTIVNS
jgi:hypothetical protein